MYALRRVSGGAAWISPSDDRLGAELVIESALDGGPTERVVVPLEGDPGGDPGNALRLAPVSGGLAAFVGREVTVVRVTRSDPTDDPQITARLTLDAKPQQVLAGGRLGLLTVVAGALERFDVDAAEGRADPAPVSEGFQSDVRGFAIVPCEHYGAVRGSEIVVLTLRDGVLVAADWSETRWALDPRVGRPLAVTADGRIVGTRGTAAMPPDGLGPDFVSSGHAFGGQLKWVDGFVQWGGVEGFFVVQDGDQCRVIRTVPAPVGP